MCRDMLKVRQQIQSSLLGRKKAGTSRLLSDELWSMVACKARIVRQISIWNRHVGQLNARAKHVSLTVEAFGSGKQL